MFINDYATLSQSTSTSILQLTQNEIYDIVFQVRQCLVFVPSSQGDGWAIANHIFADHLTQGGLPNRGNTRF